MKTSLEKHDCARCLVLRVHGLDCAEEVSLLRRAMAVHVDGEEEVTFDLMQGTMTVHRDPAQRDDQAILRSVGQTGMRAETVDAQSDASSSSATPSGWAAPRLLRLTWFSGVALALGYVLHAVVAGPVAAFTGAVEAPPLASFAFLLAAATALAHTLPKAWVAVRFLRADMHLLMTIAIIGAVLLGEFSESAMVAFLFLVSLLLESWNLERARRSVSALMALTPPTARVRCPHDGDLMERPVATVGVGSVVVVRPGERIPLDGVIIEGESLVDQSPMTGESVPVSRAPGDTVLAGTINQSGQVALRVEKAARDSTISRMLRMIEEARARRAPAEQWVDQFARWYTPAVMVAALAIAVAPPLITGAPWEDWIYRGLVLLVIACPCALVISIPVAITAALSCAARHGVLIKGGLYLEQMAGLRGIAFDKTGTLTQGRPEVTACQPQPGVADEQLLGVAAALESGAHHPLAEAIVQHAAQRGIPAKSTPDHRAEHGLGVAATVDGTPCWAGNARFAGQQASGLALPPVPEGSTAVYVGQGEKLLGLILLRDRERPESAEVVAALRSIPGMDELRMLTGDNPEAAGAVAAALGIEHVSAGLSPLEKVAAVQHMTARLGGVAMLGDGVNDAPALAAASVGIAMGAAGSDAALETADIALMKDDLRRLPWLIQHARATRLIVTQNIAFALGTKMLFMLLASVGMAGLWAAIAADTGASLLVTMNALRLLYRP